MIKALLRFLRVHSRGKESETPRDGFLSYAGEFHALAVGIAVGAYAGINDQPELFAAMIGVALGIKTGSAATKRIKKALKETGSGGFRNALAEVRREPWYTILGLGIGYTAGSWDLTAIFEVVDVIQAAL
jgi:hypothetical protein